LILVMLKRVVFTLNKTAVIRMPVLLINVTLIKVVLTFQLTVLMMMLVPPNVVILLLDV
jgi:hypothetical protein